MPFEQALAPAIEALRNGDRPTAHALLQQLTEADSARAEAWLWLAAASTDSTEKLTHLQRAWTLNPHDNRVIAALRALGEEVPAAEAELNSETPVVTEAQVTSQERLQSDAAVSFLDRPRFSTTGVRAPRQIPWSLIALLCVILLLIPATIWFV